MSEAGERLIAAAKKAKAMVDDARFVKPLEWSIDSHVVRFDDTMAFSKSYDWEGWDLREEAHGPTGSYAIWRECLTCDEYSLYGTADGIYIQGGLTEEAAKAAAQADYAARILSAIDLDAIRREARNEALREAAERMTDQRIEAVARLLCEQDGKDPDAVTHGGYLNWQTYRKHARGYIAAFDYLMKEREKP